MNLKKKRIAALIGVGLISALTSAPTLKDANAALTAPASYNYRYFYDGSEFAIYGPEIAGASQYYFTPTYARATTGGYHEYLTNFELLEGLDIQMYFKRSNTAWTASGSNYIPTDTKIGSDNTVGTITRKLSVLFDNDTPNHFLLYFDVSSGPSTSYVYSIINSTYGNQSTPDNLVYNDSFSFLILFIPSYTDVEVYIPSANGARYFDAWYLKDLGVSAAYDAGVDAGYIQGQDDADLLVTGFSAMVGILVNFVLMIANLEVLGVSLMGIFAVVVLITGIVWTLKLIRG